MKKKLLLGAGGLALVLVTAAMLAAYVALRQVPDGYFDSAGVRMHFTDEGSGVPVVLLHGYTANSDINWRLPGIHAKLREHFRVITLDARGHGLSGKPHEVSAYGIEMVHDVRRLMDELGIPKAHIVGYSMGGFLTLKFLTEYPERVISAMPCGAAWMPPGDPLEHLASNIHAGLMGASLPGPLAAAQRGLLGSVMDLKALGCLAEAFPALAITEVQLRQTTVPVMAVKGGEEEVVLGGGDLKAALPGYQEIIIPGRNHRSVVLDAAFQQAIVDFLLAHSLKQG